VIKINGLAVGQGELLLDRYLVLGPDLESVPELSGLSVKDPAFGMPALWIGAEDREKAESAGLTVVEAPAVLATHLTHIIRTHAAELLGRNEMKLLLDALKADSPSLVDELIPEVLTVGEVQKVLQNLLEEGIPIRNLVTIMETLAEGGRKVKDTATLTEMVRSALARQITQLYKEPGGQVTAVTMAPAVEEELVTLLEQSPQSSMLPWEPERAQLFVQKVKAVAEMALSRGRQPVLLTPPGLRLPLRHLLHRYIPSLPVLSYNEVTPDTPVQVMGVVSLENGD